MVGFASRFVRFRDIEDRFQVLPLLGLARFLEVAELGHCPFENARKSLGVEAEIGYRFCVVFRHDDHGGELEDIGFDGGDAVLAPGGVGQGLDEMGFGGALGIVFVGERFQVGLVCFEVLGGHDDDPAG